VISKKKARIQDDIKMLGYEVSEGGMACAKIAQLYLPIDTPTDTAAASGVSAIVR